MLARNVSLHTDEISPELGGKFEVGGCRVERDRICGVGFVASSTELQHLDPIADAGNVIYRKGSVVTLQEPFNVNALPDVAAQAYRNLTGKVA